jgi:predicted DNA-binding transcriptional regulator AlpA
MNTFHDTDTSQSIPVSAQGTAPSNTATAHGSQATACNRARVEPGLVTIKETAAFCKIGVSTLHRLRSSGKFGPQPVRIGDRVLFRTAELQRWVDAGCPDAATWAALNAGATRQRRG